MQDATVRNAKTIVADEKSTEDWVSDVTACSDCLLYGFENSLKRNMHGATGRGAHVEHMLNICQLLSS
jgi:hypothetical protein